VSIAAVAKEDESLLDYLNNNSLHVKKKKLIIFDFTFATHPFLENTKLSLRFKATDGKATITKTLTLVFAKRPRKVKFNV
jgi:hypothetical protein